MTDAEYGGVLGRVGIALTFGLVIMVIVYATGHLSAQLLGATAGALALLAIWPDAP